MSSTEQGADTPPTIQRGSLGSGSIFDDEPDPLQKTKQRMPQRKKKTAQDGEGKGQELEVPPLEERSMANMDRTLNPNPEARDRWLRKKVIQAVQRRGKLTREEQLMRTERTSVSKSHYFKTSVKKLGPLAQQIAGKNIDDAVLQMRFSVKQAAIDVRQFLEQARNEAILARGMSVNAMRQQHRQKELEEVRLQRAQSRQDVERARRRIEELKRLLTALPTDKQDHLLPSQRTESQTQQLQDSQDSPESTNSNLLEQQQEEEKKEETLEEMRKRRQMTAQETKRRWQEETAVTSIDSESAKVTIPASERDRPATWLQDELHDEEQNLREATSSLDHYAGREFYLDEEIRVARPQPVDIVLRNKKQITIPDPSAMYIAQAWVNRGPYGKGYDHRARGRIHMLRLPYTSLSVVLKEEHTRIREAREREEKDARRRRDNVWVQLPNRKVLAQRQFYCW